MFRQAVPNPTRAYNQVGYKAALLWLLIWGAPLTTLAEPRRGTEWWGKDLLVTLGLFQSDPL